MIATSVGNYPKVAEHAYGTSLIGAIKRRQRNELTDQDLERTFQAVTRAVIKEQEAAGLDLLTDGQVRWEDLVTPIARRLEGFEINGLSRWFDNNVYYRRPILHRAPKRTGPILVDEYRFARRCTSKPVKAILPGPYTFVQLCEDRYFKQARRFLMKMAEILNAEARALAGAGAALIQFDEPAYGFGKPNLKLAFEALRVTVKGVSARTALYAYYGSVSGILDALLRAPVDLIGVDLISDRHALTTLKRATVTKEVALGCLDGRNTKLESVKELHALFDTVKKRIPLDRLHVNPNCGLEFLPHAQAKAKLRRLGEAVRTYRRSR